MKNKNKLRTFAVSMVMAATGLLIYCAGFYIKSYEQNLKAKAEYMKISEIAAAGSASEPEAEQEDGTASAAKEQNKSADKKQKNRDNADKIRESFGISWENLRKINSRVVAWITIPGADISYPVAQGNDDEYYLTHNFRREEDLFGCIFLEHDNKKDFTDSHNIIYGHNMEGNMMFANLNHYERPEFLEQCPEIEIITPERRFLYRIFSVEQASPESEAFRYGYRLLSRAYKQQLSVLKSNSMYETGTEPDAAAPMVTLITCNSRLDKEIRMAVHGICYEIEEACY